jgi:hypothetical protein
MYLSADEKVLCWNMTTLETSDIYDIALLLLPEYLSIRRHNSRISDQRKRERERERKRDRERERERERDVDDLLYKNAYEKLVP